MLGKAIHRAGISYSSDGNPDRPGDPTHAQVCKEQGEALPGTAAPHLWESRSSFGRREQEEGPLD